MTNMYVPTKGGELIRLKRELVRAGFSVPPFRIIQPPFESRHGEIEAAVAHFRKMTSNRGPFPPGIMIRNNGIPQGTRKGESYLHLLDAPQDEIAERAGWSQESDKTAQGVILQLPVGQAIEGERARRFVPLLSGIAYTKEASIRKNAEVQIVPGPPGLACAGFGEYVAFNERNMEYEMRKTDLSGWAPPSAEDRRCPKIDHIIYDKTSGAYGIGGGKLPITTMGELKALGRELQRAILERLFVGVLKIGREGPLYLEWAMTCIGGKISLFALQAAEYSGKRAGLPTEVKMWAENFGEVLKKGYVDLAYTLDKGLLKERYEKAAQDERVLFAGFDVVGKDRREFDTVIWTDNMDDLAKVNGEKIAIVYDGTNISSRNIAWAMPKVGGLVEGYRSDSDNVFRGHMEGYCEHENVVGIGSVEDMSSKLLALYPDMLDGALMARMVMKGKFTMDVNGELPFGSFRVDRLDSVERLHRE